jgi:signal peptidase I
MDAINLPLVLVLLTAFTGVVVGLDRFLWRAKRPPAEDGKEPVVVEYSRAFFPILLIVLVLRSFLYEPYRIPTGSMIPTLLVGDFIFVSKFSYGLRLPVTHHKILATGEPERGDVAVFRLPSDPKINYIKRVIGLPGDVIAYRDHRLTVNGDPVALAEDGVYAAPDARGRLYMEQIGGVNHQILVSRPWTEPFEAVVPDGCYFMMGDNRDNSQDSRYREVGCVPEGNLVGRASRIWLSWQWGDWPRWGRIGNSID